MKQNWNSVRLTKKEAGRSLTCFFKPRSLSLHTLLNACAVCSGWPTQIKGMLQAVGRAVMSLISRGTSDTGLIFTTARVHQMIFLGGGQCSVSLTYIFLVYTHKIPMKTVIWDYFSFSIPGIETERLKLTIMFKWNLSRYLQNIKTIVQLKLSKLALTRILGRSTHSLATHQHSSI